MKNQKKIDEIWTEAYNIYTDSKRTNSARYNDMQRYIEMQVKNGNIDIAKKAVIVNDIRQTAGF